ncbi:ABC transporter ATP-binding protein [Halopiger xanaduensis]|uniref:Molybdate/tungstate import ATP-binding protein WtpC n=1 Tax=Halopiger xanaduensis (strain DSM 18323 / JCM 14033 / SH-6) TaxID=797210 RepID=F8D716_HALXS|nr:ABC transporter ATP-binding protein [Halopiger xanaduensis]AEH35446.1 Polyamine-transporting ATPase [Halopiger xanaduensis SH-6]
MATIELNSLEKRYGDTLAVEDVSATIADGELLCLLGPSGSGKSTTLRMIAGLESPTDGGIHVGDEDVTDQPAYERNTATVFQDWALFPHKTVLENVAFGLKMHGVPKEERRERAQKMLERVEMGDYGDQDPTNLSGGQKQRVALARSLAVEPDVLLLDEPLSNLDKRLSEDMQIELREIHEDVETTFVHVTHDQDEAFTLADRIGIMADGELVQIGDPHEVYENPKNRFVEGFLGDTNFVSGEVTETTANGVRVATELEEALEISTDETLDEGEQVTLSLRPEVLSIEPAPDATPVANEAQPIADGGSQTATVGTIENVIYRGSTVRYAVDVDGSSLFVERSVADAGSFDAGDEIRIEWDETDVLAFREDGSRIEHRG